MRRSRSLAMCFRPICTIWLMLICVVAHSADAVPLHQRIDNIVTAEFGEHAAAAESDDAEFLRRVWLDLAGSIPPLQVTKNFLADNSTDKRVGVIDNLLAAPTYARRMQETFHVLLMERRGDDEKWQQFLLRAFSQNDSWDEMVRAMLEPQASQDSHYGASFFLTKRLESYGQNPIDHPGLTRDIGRLMLGVDLQCAQCHDDLFVDEYKQLDFQGLLAITQTLKLGNSDAGPMVTEKPLATKLEFVSVFDPTQKATGPRIPFGKEFSIPAELPKDITYSPLAMLAVDLPATSQPRFARNIANRMWHLMLGHGLVEPLDQHHVANPPTHPKLLDLLAEELVSHQFDLKWLMREIALSATYQRSGRVADADANVSKLPVDRYLIAIPKRLSAEQAVRSFVQAVGEANEKQQSDDIARLMPLFTEALANPPREPEDHRHPSVQSALFFANDNDVLATIQRKPNNLVDRLISVSDDAAMADELYMSVFSRLPTAEESAELKTFLDQQPDQREARLTHWIWAMLASSEFNVN